MGYELDLLHPKTFNEKIQWYKLYYHDPDMTRCVDKVTFKDYVAERIGNGYTAQLLRVWHAPDEVCFDALPDQFVVKSNCQDNGRYVAVVQNKASCDFSAMEQEIRDYWFYPQNLIINGFCSAYHAVKPKVLVEEYLNLDATDAVECKLFCFQGEPKFIQAYAEHFKDGRVSFPAIGIYSLDWEFMNVSIGAHPVRRDFAKPAHLDEMRSIAQKLSGEFPFLRMDFYDTPEKLYLGEFTFYPNGGLKPFNPPEFDAWMGEMLHLEQLKK